LLSIISNWCETASLKVSEHACALYKICVGYRTKFSMVRFACSLPIQPVKATFLKINMLCPVRCLTAGDTIPKTNYQATTDTERSITLVPNLPIPPFTKITSHKSQFSRLTNRTVRWHFHFLRYRVIPIAKGLRGLNFVAELIRKL
jgi:hypothetical protein